MTIFGAVPRFGSVLSYVFLSDLGTWKHTTGAITLLERWHGSFDHLIKLNAKFSLPVQAALEVGVARHQFALLHGI